MFLTENGSPSFIMYPYCYREKKKREFKQFGRGKIVRSVSVLKITALFRR